MPIRHLVHNVRTPQTWRRVRPRKQRTRWFRRSWRRIAIVFGALIACGVIGVAVLFAVVSRDLPDPKNLNARFLEQSTKIYDREGATVLYEIHGDQKRTVVKFQDIPDTVKQATISAEDKDFYKHKGYDLRGIVRSVFSNVIHLSPTGQGGSTITQQLIKNTILTREKSYVRKMKEVILAYQLEKRFTKDEILSLYLNEIPYGSNAYGIEAAAQTFFGVSSKNLTLAQSALVAGLPRAPTYYSPFGDHKDTLIARQHIILDSMANLGYVTQAQADAAKQEKLEYKSGRQQIIAPHFVMYVKELLTEKYGDATVEQGGLRVITTLDLKHQQAAEDAITQYADKNQKQYKATNAALTSLDPKTGQILAMVGSRDYFDLENDGNVNVTIRPRQPGSSFKPVVYATAFDRGYTPDTVVFDTVTNFGDNNGKPYIPHNYDNKEHGAVTLRKALAGSLNIPAVKVLYLAGINNVLDMADRIGYSTLQDRSRFGLSLVLGGGEVKLLDHVSAFATFSQEGARHPTTPFLRVEDKNGKVLEEYKKQESKAMNAEVARKLISILTDNNARSFIFGSRSPLILPDRIVAAKTGTTNDFRDGWTLGFTPSLTAGVWVGNNDFSPMTRGADGVVVAAPIWHAYMQKMLAGTKVETFTAPKPDPVDKPMMNGKYENVVTLPVDKGSGKVIPDSCRSTYPQQYITEKKFKEVHTILYYVDKNDPRGLVPTKPAQDPQFAAWEAAVQNWTKDKKGYVDIKNLPQESCTLRQNTQAPTVTITAPASGATLTEATNVFSATTSGSEAIASVDFFLDGTKIGGGASPYSISYTNASLENGTHTLRVVATDVIGGTGEASELVSYALSSSLNMLVLLTPQQNAVFRVTDFPVEVSAQIFSPSGLTTIQLLADGSLADSAQTPKSGVAVLHLASLAAGQHTLEVRAQPTGGSTLSAKLTIVVQ